MERAKTGESNRIESKSSSALAHIKIQNDLMAYGWPREENTCQVAAATTARGRKGEGECEGRQSLSVVGKFD